MTPSDFQETLTNVATGAKIQLKGGYITIFKRQPNGSSPKSFSRSGPVRLPPGT